jgi:uncharacterized membrane protein YraQ (UPF0718 family)
MKKSGQHRSTASAMTMLAAILLYVAGTVLHPYMHSLGADTGSAVVAAGAA